MALADVDLDRLTAERRRSNTWKKPVFTSSDLAFVDFSFASAALEQGQAEAAPVPRLMRSALEIDRVFPRAPFVPADHGDLAERCEEIFSLQAAGLKTRLAHTGTKHAVIGLSGGLDSTLALLVTVRSFDELGLPREGITAVSMPGFGTTGRTKGNAQMLAEALGVDFREVPIHAAVEQHFQDIGHDPAVQDVTYENSQARERTQILMDIANQSGGFVIGTGDLSELALGWATYNGDHMSMYGVNASVPKTLVRHLVRYAADVFGGDIEATLLDILDTPVSPELLPPTGEGEIAQKTEDLVGPYELHDFFLYHLLRFGFTPGKILRMAYRSFEGAYDERAIWSWLRVFYRRFFAQQFKRSCLPDGPKVGSVTLSPRGDWRMPSDASSSLWLTPNRRPGAECQITSDVKLPQGFLTSHDTRVYASIWAFAQRIERMMDMEFSKRLDRFGAEVFSSLNAKRLELEAQGRTIYNLSVGTPDFAPYDHVVAALRDAATDPMQWKYSLGDPSRAQAGRVRLLRAPLRRGGHHARYGGELQRHAGGRGGTWGSRCSMRATRCSCPTPAILCSKRA